MNKIQAKLLRCLCDPELTDADFPKMLDYLYSRKFEEIVAPADYLRRTARDILRQVEQRDISDGFVKHIHNLLVKQGGLTPPKAIRALLEELRDEPVPSRKWSLRSGLEFASEFATESEIEGAAQRALAKLGSGNKHAWSLK